jgi:hypothetical protein
MLVLITLALDIGHVEEPRQLNVVTGEWHLSNSWFIYI